MELTVRPQGPVTFLIRGTNKNTIRVKEGVKTFKVISSPPLVIVRSTQDRAVIRIVQSSSPLPVTGVPVATRMRWTPPATLATWIIPHNLGYNPQVTILDPEGNLVYGNVQYLDLNTLLISFNVPFYGTAELG